MVQSVNASRMTGLRRSLLGMLLLAAGAALAQTWPSKPVRLVVPYAPGGICDLAARAIAEHISVQLGQPVIVENRAGSAGQIGTDQVARATPDGHTLLFTTNGSISFAPIINKALPYNPTKDLAPVANVASYGLILVVNPAVPIHSIAELIDYARRNPGKLNYATPGTGSAPHFAGEMLKTLANVDIVHIPYRGGAPALQDVVSGTVNFTFDGAAKPFIDAGRLRPLATTDVRRDPRFPKVPTMEEAGLKGHKIVGWLAMFAPPATPKEIVMRVNSAVNTALADEKVKARMAELGLLPVGGSPERLAKLILDEIEANRGVANAGPAALRLGASGAAFLQYRTPRDGSSLAWVAPGAARGWGAIAGSGHVEAVEAPWLVRVIHAYPTNALAHKAGVEKALMDAREISSKPPKKVHVAIVLRVPRHRKCLRTLHGFLDAIAGKVPRHRVLTPMISLLNMGQCLDQRD